MGLVEWEGGEYEKTSRWPLPPSPSANNVIQPADSFYRQVRFFHLTVATTSFVMMAPLRPDGPVAPYISITIFSKSILVTMLWPPSVIRPSAGLFEGLPLSPAGTSSSRIWSISFRYRPESIRINFGEYISRCKPNSQI